MHAIALKLQPTIKWVAIIECPRIGDKQTLIRSFSNDTA